MEAGDHVNELPFAMDLDLLRPIPPTKFKAEASPLVNSRSVVPTKKANLIKRQEKNYYITTENAQEPVGIEVPGIALIQWGKPQITLTKRYQEKIPERPQGVRHQHRVKSTWVKFNNKFHFNQRAKFRKKSTVRKRQNKIRQIDAASTLAFSGKDMYAMAHKGVNITKLIMQEWTETLTTEAKYFSSFFVFGQIKWKEAVTCTQTLGRPNPFLTRAALSIFAMAAEDFGPYKIILTLLLDKISESCIANYHHIDIPFPSSFFDALTHQEYMLYLQRCIEELEAKFVLIEQWEEEAEKEAIRRNVMFESIINIWSKGILAMSILMWRKYHALMQKSLKRISFVMTFDHKSRQLDNLWWYFNRWQTHHAHYIEVRNSTEASKKWERYTATVESNEALKTHLAGLKVDVKKMQKVLARVNEKRYTSKLRVEQLTSDLEAIKEREEYWRKHAKLWGHFTTEIGNFSVNQMYVIYLRQAYITGIDIDSRSSEEPSLGDKFSVIKLAGFVDSIKRGASSYPICSRVLRSKNAQCWVQDKAVLGNNDSKINLLLALPSCPPVLNHEEGLEMEQQIIQIKSRIEALLTPTSPVNQKFKHGEIVVVKSVVKELEKTQKEYNEDLLRVDALVDDSGEKWRALKHAGRKLEYDAWINLSGKIEAFKGHISSDTSDEVTKTAEEEQEKILKKRRIDENRFSHIEEYRLNTVIESHMTHCGVESTELLSKEDEKDQIVDYLHQHVYDIKDTFKLYSGGDGGVDSGEFIKFCKDIKVIKKKVLTGHDVELLFIKINLNSDDTDGVDKELDPDEFVLGIVHISSLRYANEPSLFVAIKTVFEQHILQYGKKVDLETFNKTIKAPEVTKIVRSYKGYLRKVFRKAADADSSQQSSKASSTMSLKEFLIFAKSMNLMRGRLSNGDVETMFANVQDNDGSDDEEEEAEMIYAEFEVAVLALACYEFPCPHTPYITRLNEYLSRLKAGTIGKATEPVIKIKAKPKKTKKNK